MSERVISDGTVMLIWECPSCGVLYGISKKYADSLRDSGGYYWCPNGHKLSWKETKADRLKRELDKTREAEREAQSCCLDAQQEVQHLRRSRDGMKGALVRTQRQLTPEAPHE